MKDVKVEQKESLVDFESRGESGSVRIARLVREKTLNSLLLETIDNLYTKINGWNQDDSVKCIILDSSSSRAFCAGADVVRLQREILQSKDNNRDYADSFFSREYRLDYLIHVIKKPIICWGSGIVMGGGLGLLSGCSHRLGTVSTKLAMPEMTIGLFPDAGGTKFLTDLPDQLGWFLGLTGCHLTAGDGLALGLLDIIVDESKKEEIFDSVSNIEWASDSLENIETVSSILKEFEVRVEYPGDLFNNRFEIAGLIEECLSAEDFLQEFENRLPTLSSNDWMSAAKDNYFGGSPTTARIFQEQMLRGKDKKLADLFRMELNIAYRCSREPDFVEGVRALLIDKDRNPSWRFSSSSEVPKEYIEKFFESPWADSHPLKDLEKIYSID
ncbi:MAG: enoyl-CoA hydratase/isomerase family protein [Candidatus Azotimanducaceae bacterium]